MEHLEYWVVKFVQTPQFKWIALIFIGLILVEIVLHNKKEELRKAAGGVSACAGMFFVYVLTALFFGPIHHSFLEGFGLESCLPFLHSSLTTSSDWAVFSFFVFPKDIVELCYGILKLYFICVIYNFTGEILDKSIKKIKDDFLTWLVVQVIIIFVFTIVISSFSYIIGRVCDQVPWFDSMMRFMKEEAIVFFVILAAFVAIVIIVMIILSALSGVKAENAPILGTLSKIFFGNIFGISLVRAAITTYFLMLIFKIVSITYVKDFVFSTVGHIILYVSLMLIFIWHMIRQQIAKKKK